GIADVLRFGDVDVAVSVAAEADVVQEGLETVTAHGGAGEADTVVRLPHLNVGLGCEALGGVDCDELVVRVYVLDVGRVRRRLPAVVQGDTALFERSGPVRGAGRGGGDAGLVDRPAVAVVGEPRVVDVQSGTDDDEAGFARPVGVAGTLVGD